MRYLISLFCLFSASLAQAAPAGTFFPYQYRQETLPNGLKAIAIPMSSPGLVSYFTIVRTGSRDEVEPRVGSPRHLRVGGPPGFGARSRPARWPAQSVRPIPTAARVKQTGHDASAQAPKPPSSGR